MTELQIIPLEKVYAVRNNRKVFAESELLELGTSIKENGLIQPISVIETDQGYELVAGERRTRASRYVGLETILAMVQPAGIDEKTAYIRMLEENNQRKDTSPIEQAEGFKHFIDNLGGSIDELRQRTGKNAAYINRRLALLELSSQAQDLVTKGQIGLTYAEAMAHLDHNRQHIAIRQLRDNPDPNLVWFQRVIKELYRQQMADNQGSFAWLAGVPLASSSAQDDSQPVIELPAEPADYAPSFDPANMLTDCQRQRAAWASAGRRWAELGYGDKSSQCEAITRTLDALIMALPSVRRDDAAQSRIMRLFPNPGDSMTAAQVYRMSNLPRAEAGPALFQLVNAGMLDAQPAGRGTRYTRL